MTGKKERPKGRLKKHADTDWTPPPNKMKQNEITHEIINYACLTSQLNNHTLIIIITIISNVSSKSDDPNSRDIGRRQFWTRLSQLPHPLFSFSREPDFF